ncbi:MAG: IMP cyclohydrolase [Deltaproteobacteria bacterium]|nr:IMP cyclohydrolase [Deltaproteobacteria bacterium]
MAENLKKAYKTIMEDHLPPKVEVRFRYEDHDTTLVYEKVSWIVNGVEKGLRYGENPGQEAALYRLAKGQLRLGNVETIEPGKSLVTRVELVQAGKHPGKINLTDVDNALNILRYLTQQPTVAIMKHNNPCGVAKGKSLEEAYRKANMADRVAAFGGAVVLNRPMDKPTAEAIAENYAEVVAAQEFEEGTIDILSGRKNLRILRIPAMADLDSYAWDRVIDYKSLMDGGLVMQTSYLPMARKPEDLKPAETVKKHRTYRIERLPTDREMNDMLFGWKVEAGVTSNSVIYVKNGVTVGIGTGEQDRVGVAKIARDKAYTKLADRICWERHHTPMNLMTDEDAIAAVEHEVAEQHGGLLGAAMISDAFFPFRDGVEVGIDEGITAVLQPGGSINDHEVIEACIEMNVTMMFTGQRSFKH